MATLALGVLGAIAGDFLIEGTILGLSGAAIGWMVGTTMGALLFGPQFPKTTREGPRLNDLTLTTSTYGSVIPRIYGSVRVPGNMIWSDGIREVRTEESF